MNERLIKNVIEAVLLVGGSSLSIQQIKLCFNEWERPNSSAVLAAIQALQHDYRDRSVELVKTGEHYSLQTRIEYRDYILRLHSEKPPRYSKALLETLAIIAYKQPVTRADIEDIRGVATNRTIIKTLLEREWIKIAGQRDVPGKPVVYATTHHFLQYFNLPSLQSLPDLPPISESVKV